MPLEHDQPGGDVDLLHQRVHLGLAVVGDWLVRDQQRRVVARDLELVQVGLVAVAGRHGGDRSVRGVHYVAGTEALTGLGQPLPPGEDRVAAVRLAAEVEHAVLAADLLEPDQMAAVVHDHRAVLARSGLVGDEEVALPDGRGVALLDEDRRRRDVRAGVEVLDAGRVVRGVPGKTDRVVTRRSGDREGHDTVLCPDQRHAGLHGHPLAGLKGVIRKEAGAQAVGVGTELPAVGPTLRAPDLDARELGRARAAEADLGLGRGHGRARRGKDRDRPIDCARPGREHGDDTGDAGGGEGGCQS